jgi:F-type H+-transporting ATPase subunit epsilon
MADALSFELVSPERLLLSREVEMVVLPGAEGDIGVLPQHAPMITTVRPGILVVFENGQPTERIFVGGGIAEITSERCTVLADEAMPLDTLDRAAAEAQISDARDDLADAKSDFERDKAEARIAVGEAKLAAIAGGSPY